MTCIFQRCAPPPPPHRHPTATTPHGLYLRFSGHLESALSASANSCLDSGAHGLSALPSGGKRTDTHTHTCAYTPGRTGVEGGARQGSAFTNTHASANESLLPDAQFFFVFFHFLTQEQLFKRKRTGVTRRAQRLICVIYVPETHTDGEQMDE